MNVRQDIEIARKALNLDRQQFGEVAHYSYDSILSGIWGHFTNLGHRAKETFRINEELDTGVVGFQYEEDIVSILREILPDDSERVWYIAADTKNERPKYWLYEGQVNSVLSIISECSYFDFYICQKKYNWLVTDTHHGIILATGEPVATRLEAL